MSSRSSSCAPPGFGSPQNSNGLAPPGFGSPQNSNERLVPPGFNSPQNTNESLDLGALCSGLLGQEGELPSASAVISPPLPQQQPDADDEGEGSTCWGGLLKDDTSACSPGFVTGKAHFKNKFCANCRKGIAVPTSRVRAMATEMRHVYQNSLRAGFWKLVPQSIGGGEVRIANNTITCDGPWLVVYRAGCGVPALPWEPMPTEWVSEDGVVQLSVAKGTLVPMAEMGVRSGKRANASYAATAPSAAQSGSGARTQRRRASASTRRQSRPSQDRADDSTRPAASSAAVCARSRRRRTSAATPCHRRARRRQFGRAGDPAQRTL